MYSYDLNIVIMTDIPEIAREVESIPPNKHFSHHIEIYDYFNPESLKNADIAVIHVPTFCGFSELRDMCKPGCRLIVCLDPEVEAGLKEEEYNLVNDIWLKPVHPARIHLRMQNLLNELKKDDEAQQHMIWLDTLIDSMPHLVWFKDLNGIHKKVNSKFCEFVNKSRDNVVGKTHSYIWGTPEDDDSCMASEDAAIRSGKTILTDEIVKVGDQKHLFKTYKTALKGLNGETLGTVGFGHDLTNLLNLDMELNFFIDAMPLALAICNADGEITQINKRFQEYFGVKKENMLGKNLDEWQDAHLMMETSPVDGAVYYRYMPEGMSARYLKVTEKDIMDIFDKKVGKVNIIRDVTSDKELEIRIWRAANTDNLTGLANRHAFDTFFKKLPDEDIVHLCYIDLDAFKAVNDNFGHEAGDEALKIVAKSIRNVFAQDFPARLGGDEFVVCLHRDVPLSELERLAGSLLRRINEKFTASNELSRMSASIGIRNNARVGDTMEKLIRQADLAMYAAKNAGKGRYCIWNESMGEA